MSPEAITAQDGLRQGAGALGLDLDEARLQALERYLALLLKWNQVYNLTAVRKPQDMLTHHLLDSLSVVPALRRHIGEHSARILDVGSGGGLPGAVLTIIDPALEVTCVDTVGKKASFIRQVAVELKLRNLHAAHARVEDLRLPAFDVVTSRAFASLVDFTRLTRPLVGERGVWMAMKGKRPDDEIDALPPDVAMFHVEQLQVPGLEAERCLVWLKPVDPQERT